MGFSASGILRATFGVQLKDLDERFQLELEGELRSTIPADDESVDMRV